MRAWARWRYVVVGLVVVALAAGARYYLVPRQASAQVAARLQGLLGVPVNVGSVDVGLAGGSEVRDVRLYEADTPQPHAPWLAVQAIQADVSALDLLVDDGLSHDITLQGVDLTLRFDEEGRLLTRLPKGGGGPMP